MMKPLMQPLHVVVPLEIRARIEKAATSRHVSLGEITRDLLQAGIDSSPP